jgi:putative acetyltransferase
LTSIRDETPADHAAIRRVHELAFGRPGEADLVDALRGRRPFTISLVATDGPDAGVVGHILFSPVTLVSGDSTTGLDAVRLLGLGPMAVLPSWQRRGIGTMLVERSLAGCRHLGHAGVVVVGHPRFYHRFGFTPARARGFACEFPVPDDVFMVLELEPGALAGRTGLVRYAPEFGALS